MKRFYIAAVAGLCAVAAVRAQEGALAPTAPVVPPPMFQNGSLVAPANGAWGPNSSRQFAKSPWSPVRSPVVPSELDPTTGSGYNTPPLPSGIGGASCGPTGCGTGSGRGFCWERVKAWLCFHNSPTELPKMRPTPYVTPIQGLFSCSSGVGCAPCGGNGQPLLAAPISQPQPAPLQMPAPMKPAGTAGAVLMPRGSMGAPTPTTWQNQMAATSTDFGTAAAKVPANQKPGQGPVVNTGYRVPVK